MSPRLEELLLQWDELRRDGKPISVETLCRDCPDLRDELRVQIAALEKLDQVLDLSDNGQSAVNNERRQTRYDDLRPSWEPIAGYRLEKPLGKGGFGEVWKAIGPGGFAVALKFVSLTGQLGAMEIRSLDVIKTLRHPNLLAIFGAWQEHGFLIVAMEIADKTLLDRLNEVTANGETGIPRKELVKYMEEAAKGIDYLNQPDAKLGDSAKEAVQHRDIKPQNIFLMGGGVKIGDFGLLRILKKTVTAHTGSLTVSYAAPEFFMGHTSQFSDQYSLAVTYCHLRGGRLPFTGQAGQIMQGHLEGTPDLTMLPEDERPIVMRALAKKPEDRWPTCGEFVKALLACNSPSSSPLGTSSTTNQKTAVVPSRSVSTTNQKKVVVPGRSVRLRSVILIGSLPAIFLLAGLLWILVSLGNGKKLEKTGTLTTQTETEAHTFLRQGREYLEQRNFPSAREALGQAIKRDPALAWAYVERAEAANNLREYDQGIADCSEAIRLAPPEDKDLIWNGFMRRGHAYRDKKNLDQAIADYTEALKCLPENGHGYLWRGKAFRSKNDRDQGITDLTAAIRLAPATDTFLLTEAYEYRGHCYREKGKQYADKAITDYTDSLKYRPDNGFLYWRRAWHTS